MRAKHVLWTIAMVYSIYGCALPTEKGYRQLVDAVVGRREESLISMWGVPQGIYESGGKRFLTYRGSRIISHKYGTVTHGCVTTFAVVEGTIVSYTFSGDDCMAYESGSNKSILPN